MHLHIGGNYLVAIENIVGIIDMERVSSINQRLIDTAKSQQKIIMVNKREKVKTCIITYDKIYMTSISPGTLAKRVDHRKGYAKPQL